MFENQRYQPGAGGWGSSYPGHLLPTDRNKYTDEPGRRKFKCKELVDLQPARGYEFQGSWKLDKDYTLCDEEGWSYAQDMWNLSANLKSESSMKAATGTTWTRRRKWVRTQIEKPVPLMALDSVKTGMSTPILKEKGTKDKANLYLSLCEKNGHSVDIEVEDEDIKNILLKGLKRVAREEKDLEKLLIKGPMNTDAGQKTMKALNMIEPFAGCAWTGKWSLDVEHTVTDDSGWSYALDFPQLNRRQRTNSSLDDPYGCWTRRRKWVRDCAEVSQPILDVTAVEMGAASGATAWARYDSYGKGKLFRLTFSNSDFDFEAKDKDERTRFANAYSSAMIEEFKQLMQRGINIKRHTENTTKGVGKEVDMSLKTVDGKITIAWCVRHCMSFRSTSSPM